MNRRQFLKLAGKGAAAVAALPMALEAVRDTPVQASGFAPYIQKKGYVPTGPVEMFESPFPREDLMDVITIIDPVETPLMDMLVRGGPVWKPKPVYHEWLSDELEEP